MDIMERITKAHAEFVGKAGHQPDWCYLGEQESFELKKWAVKNQYYNSIDSVPDDGVEVMGAKVLEVKTEHHLAFS